MTLNNSTSASNIAVLATAIHNAGGYSEITTRGIVVRSMDDSPVGITGSMPSDFIILAGKKGSFTAVVKYAGDSYYNAKTVKPKIIVK